MTGCATSTSAPAAVGKSSTGAGIRRSKGGHPSRLDRTSSSASRKTIPTALPPTPPIEVPMTASTNHRKPARSRLAVLEAAQAKRRPTYAEPHQWAEEEWLTMFRKRADQGLYADEPEFPQA